MGLADDVVAAARQMLRLGLVSGTAGNVSARVDDRTFLVTPSGTPYDALGPADLVVVDLDGAVLRGERRPSSEWALHAECYRALPDAAAVVHTHPVHATMFACARRSIPVAVDEFALYAGGEVRCAAYAPSGTVDLGRNAAAALTPARSALLASHGMVTVGASPAAAVHDAEVVERGAHVVWGTAALGGYVPLDPPERGATMPQPTDGIGGPEPRIDHGDTGGLGTDPEVEAVAGADVPAGERNPQPDDDPALSNPEP